MKTFKNAKELSNFLTPVLKIRSKSLQKEEKYLNPKEIFDYFKKNKWIYQKDLHIYQMVEDILHGEIKLEK